MERIFGQTGTEQRVSRNGNRNGQSPSHLYILRPEAVRAHILRRNRTGKTCWRRESAASSLFPGDATSRRRLSICSSLAPLLRLPTMRSNIERTRSSLYAPSGTRTCVPDVYGWSISATEKRVIITRDKKFNFPCSLNGFSLIFF